MATFDISPLFRSASWGLDRPWDFASTALNFDGTGYPAYNILKTGEDNFRISIAVPGLKAEDIAVESREKAVWVKAGRDVDPDHNRYLYRGFGVSAFQRTFELPDHVRVYGARLEQGVLHIELVRELPESMRPRQIEIQVEQSSQPHIETKAQAA